MCETEMSKGKGLALGQETVQMREMCTRGLQTRGKHMDHRFAGCCKLIRVGDRRGRTAVLMHVGRRLRE